MTQSHSLSPHDSVKEYYGETLRGSVDLKTNACTCSAAPPSRAVREALENIHPEILERFYGCGSPLPPLLEGRTVLDLGCGTGRDVFVAACLAGPNGRVIGVDMTENQIAIARKHEREQAKRFGFARPTTEFLLGPIEDLDSLGIGGNSVDVVMSNCVINLSPRKEDVFREIFRVLKPGGELIFSDVFADRRIPGELRHDPVLLGECLAGALYLEDFRRLLAELNCPEYRVVSRAPLDIGDPGIEEKIGFMNFESLTVRAFKLESLEDACEDYGQTATYQGTIPGSPHAFSLDTQHRFPAGKPLPVCGNTAAMLRETRYEPHFHVQGDRTRHFGLFPCERPRPAPPEPGAGSCC